MFQSLMIRIVSFLGAPANQFDADKNAGGGTGGSTSSGGDIDYGNAPEWVVEIIKPIIDILNSLLVPVIILLGTAGTIYAIVLGVQYSKAETADKRDEAKKRLIHAAIGIVIMLVALILLKIFTANANKIFKWVDDTAAGGNI